MSSTVSSPRRAGTSLDTLMRALVPRGYFVPVTPGTRQVTVGGAIAADIHGKNHHKKGSWCSHVESFRLATPDGHGRGVARRATPTCSGPRPAASGSRASCSTPRSGARRSRSSRLLVDTDRPADLDAVMALMEATDDDYDYTVAWIDLVAKGRALGRSVLTSGRFARRDELDPHDEDPLGFDPYLTLPAPPWVPSGLLNRLSVRAFNEFWFRKAPVERRDELQTISQFFHPLDMVEGLESHLRPSRVPAVAVRGALRGRVDAAARRRDAELHRVHVVPRRAQAHGRRRSRSAVVPRAGLDACARHPRVGAASCGCSIGSTTT